MPADSPRDKVKPVCLRGAGQQGMPGANGVPPAASPPLGPPELARAVTREERGGGYTAPPAREERPARQPPAFPQPSAIPPAPAAPARQPPQEEEEEDANSYDSDEGSAYPGCLGSGEGEVSVGF